MKTLSRIALVFCCFCYFLFPLSTTQVSAATTREPKVYITSYGDCYHSSSCQYLYNSKRAIGKYKAQSLGYYACSVCGGTSSGYIVEYYSTEESSSPSYNYPKTSSSKTESDVTTGQIIGFVILCGVGYMIIYALIASFKNNR